MKFFDLTLRDRLLLALAPGIVVLLPATFDDLVVYGYAVLFGALVMVPFIVSRSKLVLRIAALVVTPLVALYLLSFTMTGDVPGFLAIDPLRTDFSLPGIAGLLFDTLEIALILALLPAYVLRIAAPLVVSWQYWNYALLSGIFTAVAIYAWVQWFLCIFGCSWWDDASTVLPLTAWALSFSIAVEFGRRSRAGRRLPG